MRIVRTKVEICIEQQIQRIWSKQQMTYQETLADCKTMKELYYTFVFLRDMGHKVDKADFKQAYKNRFEELKNEMSIQKANSAHRKNV